MKDVKRAISAGVPGKVVRDGGGMHRFAIAYILRLEKISAQLGVIHADAGHAGLMQDLRTPPGGTATTA